MSLPLRSKHWHEMFKNYRSYSRRAQTSLPSQWVGGKLVFISWCFEKERNKFFLFLGAAERKRNKIGWVFHFVHHRLHGCRAEQQRQHQKPVAAKRKCSFGETVADDLSDSESSSSSNSEWAMGDFPLPNEKVIEDLLDTGNKTPPHRANGVHII